MKRVLPLLFILILSSLVILSWQPVSSSPAPAEPTPSQLEQSLSDQVGEAIYQEIAQRGAYLEAIPAYEILVDDLRFSLDGKWATGWILLKDVETEQVLPSEPGLAVVSLADSEIDVILPDEQGWGEAIQSLPDDLLSASEKELWLARSVDQLTACFPTQSGYLLPWEAGDTVGLSRSVSHDEDYPSGNAHYAFDFFVPGLDQAGFSPEASISGLMFPLYASKAGTVWSFRDDVENNNHDEVNFLVLRDAFNHEIFQLYLHLAQDSIPPALKQIGAQVIQGQFIGIADNTGASTGHHLHFQVETLPYWPIDNPYWGQACDITFDEVDIYGGRPRRHFEVDDEICGGTCSDGRLYYVSSNVPKGDLIPPDGVIQGVNMGDVIRSQYLVLTGNAWDEDGGLYSGQLIANYNGAWRTLGSPFNPSFSYTWDLCAANSQVPDGVVSVALRLYDVNGNWASHAALTHFTKRFTCPTTPPVGCDPAVNQVVLFEEPNYMGGCTVYEVGEYADGLALGALGDNDGSSIRVGGNVYATLYSEANFTGHAETFSTQDSYLVDNRIGDDALSSMKVVLRTAVPEVPVLIGPANGEDFSAGDVIPLSWKDSGGALEFQVKLTPATSPPITLDWGEETYLQVDGLTEDNYSWQVRARNQAGEGAWSSTRVLDMLASAPITSTFTLPYSDDLETSQDDWQAGGLWTWIDDAAMSRSDTHSWWYQGSDGDYATGSTNYGVLTSPAISVTLPGYYLRFWYRYATETRGVHWDQRWVQISQDVGPFMNLWQLSDDPQIPDTSKWMQSPAIDLSDYAGHTIRVRFSFATLDSFANGYDGWGIDDFSITAIPPRTCTDLREDDTPQQATPLVVNGPVLEGEICPGGDVDYYSFTGQAGQRIVVNIDAESIGSKLDSYLVLYDTDGTTVLAEHDDEIYAQLRDSLLVYQLSKNGTYYVKTRAWNHPTAGSDNQDYSYTIRLVVDEGNPVVELTNPVSGSYLPGIPFPVTVLVSDALSDIGRVDFYWHSADWLIPNWTYLGYDADGTDGWWIEFDPSGYIQEPGSAIYVQAYDVAGNWESDGAWNLQVDKTAPASSMQPIAPSQDSTAFLLKWQGSDDISGIDYYELQQSIDAGGWQDYPETLPGDELWYIASAGHAYDFRLRAVDGAGNQEAYPGTAEVTTTVPAVNVLCATLDAYETDNTSATASDLVADGSRQLHNFCNPAAPDRANDVDWIAVQVSAGIKYLFQSRPLHASAAPVIRLYESDGVTLITERAPAGFGQSVVLAYTPEQDGVLYMRIRHLNGSVLGSAVTYQVWVQEGYLTYFPIVEK